MLIQENLSPNDFDLFRTYIEKNSGIYIEENRKRALSGVLLERIKGLKLYSYMDYYNFLNTNKDTQEFQNLVDLITTNETYFFRNRPHYSTLCYHVIPELMEQKRKRNLTKTIKIWSAGCSSGEEAYSIAIMLQQHFLIQGWRFIIIGTDVNTDVLNKARNGIYRWKSLQSLSDVSLRRHFTRVDKYTWQISPEIKKMVDFRYFNLIKEPFQNFTVQGVDIIFCRNVTIYFKEESTRRVIANFYNILEDGGYFFIGHSESLTNINQDFVPKDFGNALIYRKEKSSQLWRKSRTTAPKPEIAKFSSTLNKTDSPLNRKTPKREERHRPINVQELYEDGMRAYSNSDRLDARAKFEKLVEAKPDSSVGFFMLGQICSDQGSYEEAEKYYCNAITINPLHLESHFLLGITYYHRHNFLSAEREFKKCIYINCEFGLGFYSLANLYKEDERISEAVKEYKNAINCFKKSPDKVAGEYFGGFSYQLLINICRRNINELQSKNSH